MHIGGLRVALYNYLFAKKQGGEFILRIDDTDQSRLVTGAEDYIKESLEWTGIKYDLTFKQSDRLAVYQKAAKDLVKAGHAYYAFDTEEDLSKMKGEGKKYDFQTMETMKNSRDTFDDQPYVIRMMASGPGTVSFTDSLRGDITVERSTLDDKVLLKSDGFPTYHLASCVDDLEFGITHIIRGDDWLPSTATHSVLIGMLWSLPDYPQKVIPEFTHLPMILGPDGKKLKKRSLTGFPVYPLTWTDPESGEVTVGYRERGYLPGALLNNIALLGWNPGEDKEVMSLDQMVQEFDLNKIHKAGARFDEKKAAWFGRTYLGLTDNRDIAKMWMPTLVKKMSEVDDKTDFVTTAFDERSGALSIDYVAAVCGLLKERQHYVDEFWDRGSYFFVDPFCRMVGGLPLLSNEFDFLGRMANTVLSELPDTPDEFRACFDKTMGTATGHELSDKSACGKVLRLAVTGATVGPDIFKVMSVLGFGDTSVRLGIGEK